MVVVQIVKVMQVGKVIVMVYCEGVIDYVVLFGVDVVFLLIEGWVQQVCDYIYGQGVDIVVDFIGGLIFDDVFGVLVIDGKLLLIGFVVGVVLIFKVNWLLVCNISVVGVGWGEYFNVVFGLVVLFVWG